MSNRKYRMEEKQITYHLFTDGSATDQSKTFHKKELRRAGIGIYHPESDTRISEPFPLPEPTNNRAEYYACIRALHWVLDENKDLSLSEQSKIKIYIYSDSQLLIHSMTKWAKGWKVRGWKKKDGKPVKNQELVEKLYTLITQRFPKTEFIKVKAHQSEPKDKSSKKYYLWKGNHIADRLAYQARKEAEKV